VRTVWRLCVLCATCVVLQEHNRQGQEPTHLYVHPVYQGIHVQGGHPSHRSTVPGLALLARLVPWLVPDRPAPLLGAVHGHVPGRSCGLGCERGRAVAQCPANDDLAWSPLVPVRAGLRIEPRPPSRAPNPHGGGLEHTFEHIYTNRALAGRGSRCVERAGRPAGTIGARDRVLGQPSR
jgi:hypothetical protein